MVYLLSTHFIAAGQIELIFLKGLFIDEEDDDIEKIGLNDRLVVGIVLMGCLLVVVRITNGLLVVLGLKVVVLGFFVV